MKVLQINSVYKFGSTGNIVFNLHNLLVEEGHDSYVGYGRGEYSNDTNIYKFSNKFDMYLHVLGSRIFDKHGLYSKKITEEFIQKIKKIDPDIIHLHNIHGYYVNYEILFKFLQKFEKPVVWTLHDCWSFTGHCAYYDFVDCKKWQEECYSCPQLDEYPKSLFFDNSRENFVLKKKLFTSLKNMTIVTPSQWLAGEVKKSFLKDFPVKVINNGIDVDMFQETQNNFRKKHSLENKFLILGVASVWEERKGLPYFMQLADKITKNECIVLVGLNEQQMQNLPHNIIGIKRTQNLQELVDIYSSVDVFVNPTLEDNFPTTNLESLACGTPVVTFDSGGSKESIDNFCGIVVEKGNLEALYKAILTIKDSREDYSQRCRRRVEKSFNKNDRFNDYIKLYNIIIQNSRKR